MTAQSPIVSREMTGYQDLDANGQWSTLPDYGPVWIPTAVASDWAPYQFGHWAYIEPWGWIFTLPRRRSRHPRVTQHASRAQSAAGSFSGKGSIGGMLIRDTRANQAGLRRMGDQMGLAWRNRERQRISSPVGGVPSQSMILDPSGWPLAVMRLGSDAFRPTFLPTAKRSGIDATVRVPRRGLTRQKS